jgi:hypothetical protein
MPRTINPEQFENHLRAFLRHHFPHLEEIHEAWAKHHRRQEYQRRSSPQRYVWVREDPWERFCGV